MVIYFTGVNVMKFTMYWGAYLQPQSRWRISKPNKKVKKKAIFANDMSVLKLIEYR